MASNNNQPPFWITLPGIITATSGLVVAIGTFVGILYGVGVLGERTPPRPEPFEAVGDITPTVDPIPTIQPPPTPTTSDEPAPSPLSLQPGVYTIQQKSNGRFVDAHESGNAFSVVTRTAQNNDTQRWVLIPEGNNTYTIQQMSNGRFMDAHESGNDFSVVTWTLQNNDTQRWILTLVGNNTYTIQQKSNGRFVDAHESENDFSVVTRTAQNNDTQRWIIKSS